MSSSNIFEQQKPETRTYPSFEFWRQVGLITGGTLLSISMVTSSVVAGGWLV
jgi:hypothetical protein